MRNSYRDSHFNIWKNRIEKNIQNKLPFHITLDSIPDEPYRVWFEETHWTPNEVAELVLFRNGF